MEQSLGLDGFGERQIAVEAEPGSRVPMPLDVESVAADPVEPCERAVELFARVLRKAGSVALEEPVAACLPLAQDVDRIVERGRSNAG